MTWVLLILASLLSFAGQFCQKQATRPTSASGRGRHVVRWLGLALVCLGVGLLVWLLVLQRLPVGLAYPMLSLNFVWVTLAAWGVWREPVSVRHWLGVGLIIIGIITLGGAA